MTKTDTKTAPETDSNDTADTATDEQSLVVQQYIGTKLLAAKPMTRGDYNAYRGWKPPEGEDQTVPGYLVSHYPDGYESWSPADVFEEAYLAIPEGVDGERLLELTRRYTAELVGA